MFLEINRIFYYIIKAELPSPDSSDAHIQSVADLNRRCRTLLYDMKDHPLFIEVGDQEFDNKYDELQRLFERWGDTGGQQSRDKYRLAVLHQDLVKRLGFTKEWFESMRARSEESESGKVRLSRFED